MSKKPNIAIVGATGVVGSTFLKVLEERDFPFENVYMMASAKSAGKTVTFKGKEYVVEELNEHSFEKDIDIALFSAGGSTSEKYAPIAAKCGVTVVDNSSQWRMDPEVPLVVPEVNADDIKWNKGIIANPNCSTIQGIVSGWMDAVSIYVCPLGAMLAGIMFFWVMDRKHAEDAVNAGAKKPIGNWFFVLGKFVLVPLALIALIAGAVLGGIG